MDQNPHTKPPHPTSNTQLEQQAAVTTSQRSAAELSEALAAAQSELEAERAAGAMQEARLTQLAAQLVRALWGPWVDGCGLQRVAEF
jgi:hypothetical protein